MVMSSSAYFVNVYAPQLSINDNDYRALFSPFGKILQIEFLSQNAFTNTTNERGNWSASVVFNSNQSAWQAYEHLNGITFLNEAIRVSTPQPFTRRGLNAENGMIDDQGSVSTAPLHFDSLPGDGHRGFNQPPTNSYRPSPTFNNTAGTMMGGGGGGGGMGGGFQQDRSFQQDRGFQQDRSFQQDRGFQQDRKAFLGPPSMDYGAQQDRKAFLGPSLDNNGLGGGPAGGQEITDLSLPSVDEILIRGNLAQSFHSAQLLVSFKVREVYGVQHGYGFLHFSRSWTGIQQALLAPNVFKHRYINGILFDCNLSYQLLQFLSVLRNSYGIDLVAFYDTSGPGANNNSRLLSEVEMRLNAFEDMHGGGLPSNRVEEDRSSLGFGGPPRGAEEWREPGVPYGQPHLSNFPRPSGGNNLRGGGGGRGGGGRGGFNNSNFTTNWASSLMPNPLQHPSRFGGDIPLRAPANVRGAPPSSQSYGPMGRGDFPMPEPSGYPYSDREVSNLPPYHGAPRGFRNNFNPGRGPPQPPMPSNFSSMPSFDSRRPAGFQSGYDQPAFHDASIISSLNRGPQREEATSFWKPPSLKAKGLDVNAPPWTMSGMRIDLDRPSLGPSSTTSPPSSVNSAFGEVSLDKSAVVSLSDNPGDQSIFQPTNKYPVEMQNNSTVDLQWSAPSPSFDTKDSASEDPNADAASPKLSAAMVELEMPSPDSHPYSGPYEATIDDIIDDSYQAPDIDEKLDKLTLE
eukprot:scaffold659_cov192-Ochromonas_danica.AAC.68